MKEELLKQAIIDLSPWHHDIKINDSISTGKVFSPDGTLPASSNDKVSLISPRGRFRGLVNEIFNGDLSQKRFLDCACNAGGYCFWAREMGADYSLGFDVRDHWIRQAKFVQEHTVLASDKIDFRVKDLYDLKYEETGLFDFTYFSGIFYHLPDPITGLKIAADKTSDVLLFNTAWIPNEENRLGMTMAFESTENLMSGVHRLSWFPNSIQLMVRILGWLGFVETVLTYDEEYPNNRRRMEIIASKKTGRLENLKGKHLKVKIKK